jgi:hypothetical protein
MVWQAAVLQPSPVGQASIADGQPPATVTLQSAGWVWQIASV